MHHQCKKLNRPHINVEKTYQRNLITKVILTCMILSNRIKTDIAVNYICVIKRLKWKFKYNIDMIYVHIIEKGTTTKT